MASQYCTVPLFSSAGYKYFLRVTNCVILCFIFSYVVHCDVYIVNLYHEEIIRRAVPFSTTPGGWATVGGLFHFLLHVCQGGL